MTNIICRDLVYAQDPVYEDAIGILRRGMMCTPYMEFMFPRLASGGSDDTLEPYAIRSLDEANAYISSPLLGGRMRPRQTRPSDLRPGPYRPAAQRILLPRHSVKRRSR